MSKNVKVSYGEVSSAKVISVILKFLVLRESVNPDLTNNSSFICSIRKGGSNFSLLNIPVNRYRWTDTGMIVLL